MSEDNQPQGKMGEPELLALIAQYELASLGSAVAAGATISSNVAPTAQQMTTLELDRYNALNAYFARPLGNEVENRSQIVLPELRDTIEWTMPQLMRIFMGTSSPCRFDPEGAQDEEPAKVETATVNHVFMHENNGFFVLHDFFKDSLLMRNGYVKVYWKKSKQTSVSRYTGLSEIELVSVLHESKAEKVEVLEQREYIQVIPTMLGMPPQTLQLFDIKVRRTATREHVCIDCIPPEEMRVTPRAREGMEDLAFVAHVTEKTRSDLIAEGFDRDIIESAAAGKPNWLELDALARNQVTDQLSVENPSDRAMQEIELREVIMKVDFDGDGIAELRRVIVAGDKIVENEVIEETPFASCVPKRMPHRHTGLSLYDEIMDLQIIKTELFRQGIDNLKLSMNQRTAVDYNSVNLDDLLTSRPGGIVRGKGPPSQWIEPINHPSNLMEQVIPAMNYVDEMKSSRTGIGPGSMPVDPDELQNVTKGAHAQNLATAALKVEMLARLLAEGVKPIFLKIRALLLRHQDKPLEFQVSGKWLNIDPQTWKPHRTNVQPNVGLGSGNRDEMRQNVIALMAGQKELAAIGLVNPKKAYEGWKVYCESLGFTSPERFALDPSSDEYKQWQAQQAQQPQPQAPQVQAAQIRSQTTVQQEQAENQRLLLKMQAEQQKGNNQMVHEAIQTQQDREHEATQNMQDRAHDHQQGHKDREVQLDASHERMTETLIKAFAQILAAEKANPKELAQDVTEAEAEIEEPEDPQIDPNHERMMQLMEGLHGALQKLGGPRTATLSDGRKITIQ